MKLSLPVNILPLAICTIFSIVFSVAITAFSVSKPILFVVAALLVTVVVYFSMSRGTLMSADEQFHKSNFIIRFLLVAAVLSFFLVTGLSIFGIAHNPFASLAFSSLGIFFAYLTLHIFEKEFFRYIDSELTSLEDTTH